MLHFIFAALYQDLSSLKGVVVDFQIIKVFSMKGNIITVLVSATFSFLPFLSSCCFSCCYVGINWWGQGEHVPSALSRVGDNVSVVNPQHFGWLSN